MKTFRKIGTTAILFCLPFITFAWGTNGHRISGEIAFSYLSPKAKAAVQQILGNESLALASNWADFIKSDDAYQYLSSWHYIDLDNISSYSQLQAYLATDTETDAYTKLNFLITELKKTGLSKENKLLYLHMLIHITEDLHQPLHTVKTEQGGNGIKVVFDGKETNLHSLWDSGLIDFQKLSYTEYAAAINHTTPAQLAEWQKAPISQWIFDSNQLAVAIVAGIKPNVPLNTYKYNFNYVDTLNQQLLKGGVHLAGILNELFGK